LALLAVLFNVDIYRGELLESFLDFTKDFSPIVSLANLQYLHKVYLLLYRIVEWLWVIAPPYAIFITLMQGKRTTLVFQLKRNELLNISIF
jgi:hypothetical protein